jgi:APA family basic amino acid/polyamine antiporter
MARSELVASDVAQKLLGPAGAALIAIAIVISTLGSNNGIIFTAARIPYAMAKAGLFFKSMAKVNEKYRVPLMSWLFYAMSCGAVIILRCKAPQMARPYKTWGYPVVPVVFILFALWLMLNTIIEAPRDAAFGAGIILLGLPIYFYWKRQTK